jgi:hypothetical protein
MEGVVTLRSITVGSRVRLAPSFSDKLLSSVISIISISMATDAEWFDRPTRDNKTQGQDGQRCVGLCTYKKDSSRGTDSRTIKTRRPVTPRGVRASPAVIGSCRPAVSGSDDTSQAGTRRQMHLAVDGDRSVEERLQDDQSASKVTGLLSLPLPKPAGPGLHVLCISRCHGRWPVGRPALVIGYASSI